MFKQNNTRRAGLVISHIFYFLSHPPAHISDLRPSFNHPLPFNSALDPLIFNRKSNNFLILTLKTMKKASDFDRLFAQNTGQSTPIEPPLILPNTTILLVKMSKTMNGKQQVMSLLRMLTETFNCEIFVLWNYSKSFGCSFFG